MLADKGYDTNYVTSKSGRIGAQAVIPSKSNRTTERTYDKKFIRKETLLRSYLTSSRISGGWQRAMIKTVVALLGFANLADILFGKNKCRFLEGALVVNVELYINNDVAIV